MISEIIDIAQVSFMPGRNIYDNILLATELIKGYTTKHISPRCMMKVDLKKACDSIEWPFLNMMLSELGFPTKFIGWVMACVTSTEKAICVGCEAPICIGLRYNAKGLDANDPELICVVCGNDANG